MIVSILVLVDITLILVIYTCIILSNSFVSILVLVDITLIHYTTLGIGKSQSCFNPCFSGYYTYTSTDDRVIIFYNLFQSLF